MKFNVFRFSGVFFALLVSIPLLGACVSSNSARIDPQQATYEQPEQLEEVSYNPQARADAVIEIRSKASQRSGELTNAFASGDGPAEPMTKQEQAQRIADMEKNASINSGAVSDAEVTDSQRSVKSMKWKAKSHYQKAVEQIENE